MPRGHQRGQQLSLKDFHGGSIQTGSVALPSAPKSDRSYTASSGGSGEYSNRNQYASSSLAQNAAYNDRYKSGYASRGSYDERPPPHQYVSPAEFSHGYGNSAYSGGGADFTGRGGYGGSGPRGFDGGDSGAARWSPDRDYGPGGGRAYRPHSGRDNGTPPDAFDIPPASYRPPKSAGQQARMEAPGPGLQTTTENNSYGNFPTTIQSRLLAGGGMSPFGEKPVIHSRLVDPDPRTLPLSGHSPPLQQQHGTADNLNGVARVGGVGGPGPRGGYQPTGQHPMSGQGHGNDYGDVHGSSLLVNGAHASGYADGRLMRSQAGGNGPFHGQNAGPQQPYAPLASSVPMARQQEAIVRNGPAPFLAAESRPPVNQQAASRIPEKMQPDYSPPQQPQQMRPSYQDFAPVGPYSNGMGGRPQQQQPPPPYSQLVGPPANSNPSAQNYQQAPYSQLVSGPGIQQQPPYQQPYSQLVNGPLVGPAPISARTSPPHSHGVVNGPRSGSPSPATTLPAAAPALVQRPRLNLLPRSQPPPELPRPEASSVVVQVAAEKPKSAASDGDRPMSTMQSQPVASAAPSNSRPSSARSSASESAGAKSSPPPQASTPTVAATTDQAAPQRPKLNLLPRSLPLDNPPPAPTTAPTVVANRPTSASSSGSGGGSSTHGRPSGGSSDDAKWQRVSHSRNGSAGTSHQPLAPGFSPYFHSALVDPPALMLTAIGTETFGGGPVGRSDNCSWQSNNLHGRMGGVAVGGSAGQLWGNSGTW